MVLQLMEMKYKMEEEHKTESGYEEEDVIDKDIKSKNPVISLVITVF